MTNFALRKTDKIKLKMSQFVHRFLLKAIPSENNSEYLYWQIATLCILIGDDNKILALNKARCLIDKKKWLPVSEIYASTLIESIIYQHETSLIANYEKAKIGKDCFLVFTDEWWGFRNLPLPIYPKITEEVIDRVFEKAGGGRLPCSAHITVKNADYVIDDYIFELKMIREAKSIKQTFQDKMTSLYKNKTAKFIDMEAIDFDEINYKMYADIFKKSVRHIVEYSSEQIKSTKKNILKNKKYKGGIFILSKGLSSFTPDFLRELVSESLRKYAKTIKSGILVSIWVEADGSDTSLNYSIMFNQTPIEKRLQQSFEIVIREYLTEWAKKYISDIKNPHRAKKSKKNINIKKKYL